jgi:hypothetical protein
MSEQKNKLRRVLKNLPLDGIERQTTEESIEKMNGEEAEDIANNLEKSAAELADALGQLNADIDKYTQK